MPRDEQCEVAAWLAGKVLNMDKIREFLKGKKTYIMAAIGLAGSIMAWAEGQITGTQVLAAAWAAISSCTLRAGINNSQPTA